MEVARNVELVQLEMKSLLLAGGGRRTACRKRTCLAVVQTSLLSFLPQSGEGNERDEVEDWGREAIKAVGDADFQWRRHASAAKSAQAAAAPAALRCLGEAVRIYRTACKSSALVLCVK